MDGFPAKQSRTRKTNRLTWTRQRIEIQHTEQKSEGRGGIELEPRDLTERKYLGFTQIFIAVSGANVPSCSTSSRRNNGCTFNYGSQFNCNQYVEIHSFDVAATNALSSNIDFIKYNIFWKYNEITSKQWMPNAKHFQRLYPRSTLKLYILISFM